MLDDSRDNKYTKRYENVFTYRLCLLGHKRQSFLIGVYFNNNCNNKKD